MKREHEIKEDFPIPYVHCPFTDNANDIYEHLTWSTVNSISFDGNCANFNGSSSYLEANNTLPTSRIKTFTYLIKFNRIPTDGVSSTWHTGHYITYNNNSNYRNYCFFQHYSGENVELTNCMQYQNTFSISNNVLTTPFGSTVINKWYRITFRRNNGSTDLWIDDYHKVINESIPDNYINKIIFGKVNNNRYLDGALRDLKIFDTELTDEQIAEL